MSPRNVFLFLVLGLAAASKILSPNLGGMIGSLMTNNLAMAITLSKLPPDELSIDGRDQLRGRSTSPEVRDYEHILDAWKLFKVTLK